jgi:hypothetical protein
MDYLRSRKLRFLLFQLLGCALITAPVVSCLEGTRYVLTLEAASSHSLLLPLGEKDNSGDSTTDRCCGENEIPGNVPPEGLSLLAAASFSLGSVPYLNSIPPEVYLERFIPPQNRT